jgi:hypothetical protein
MYFQLSLVLLLCKIAAALEEDYQTLSDIADVSTALQSPSSSAPSVAPTSEPIYLLNTTVDSASFFEYFTAQSHQHLFAWKHPNNQSVILKPKNESSTIDLKQIILSTKPKYSISNEKPSLVFLDIPHVPEGPCEMRPFIDLVTAGGKISLLSDRVQTFDSSCNFTVTLAKEEDEYSYISSSNNVTSEGSFAIELTNTTVKFWKRLDTVKNRTAIMNTTEFGEPRMLVQFNSDCKGWMRNTLSIGTLFCDFLTGA